MIALLNTNVTSTINTTTATTTIQTSTTVSVTHVTTNAMNGAEILSVKGEVANEHRILLKIKRSGVADISYYKKNRKNHYLDTEASKKLGESII